MDDNYDPGRPIRVVPMAEGQKHVDREWLFCWLRICGTLDGGINLLEGV